jgi:hypothetical protein
VSDGDVHTPAGAVGDLVDAVKRGAVGLRDGAGRVVDDMRDAWEKEKMRRALRLAMVLGAAYYLLRRNAR